MEMQYFVKPGEDETWFDFGKNKEWHFIIKWELILKALDGINMVMMNSRSMQKMHTIFNSFSQWVART